MVLGWSRAIYVEFVRRADVASFMQCHVNAFEYFGGVPRRCLYDNAKVVVLGPRCGWASGVEPADAGPVAAHRIRAAGVPAVSGPDEGEATVLEVKPSGGSKGSRAGAWR